MMQRTFHLKALIDSELHGISLICQPDSPLTDLSATLNGDSVTLVARAGGEEVAFGVLDLSEAPRPVKAGETLILVVDDPAGSIQGGRASKYEPRTFAFDGHEVELIQAWEITEGNEQTTAVMVVSRAMASTGRLELNPQVLPGFPEARPGQVLTRTEADVKWGDVSSVFPIYLSGPEKNVSQPLDPVDFPVVQYADDLQPGGVARVESELKYRRPDGTLVSLGGGGGLNAKINEEGYYESTDGPEDQPATMTNAELIAAVTENLRQPQIIDGLKYASPELNYDSARDGWGAIASVPLIDLQERHTDYYQIGVYGELYTGAEADAGVRGANVGGASTAIDIGDVASIAFTLTKSVIATGIRVGIPSNGPSFGGILTFRVRLLREGTVLFEREHTVGDGKYGAFGVAQTVPFTQSITLDPAAYSVEYVILSVQGEIDQGLRRILLDPLLGSEEGIPFQAPFANEDFRIRVNGVDVGWNAMLGVETTWTNRVLAQEVTLTPDGGDLIVEGSGLAAMSLPVAPIPRGSPVHHKAIMEFTVDPRADADHYSFGVAPAPTLSTNAEKYILGNRVMGVKISRGQSGGGLYRPGTDYRLGWSVSSGRNVGGTSSWIASGSTLEARPRYRLEMDIYFGKYMDAQAGIEVSGFTYKYTLYDARTGVTLAATSQTPIDSFNTGTAPFCPHYILALTPGFRYDWEHARLDSPAVTKRFFGMVVPEGVEKPARIRVHRWIEWRENA